MKQSWILTVGALALTLALLIAAGTWRFGGNTPSSGNQAEIPPANPLLAEAESPVAPAVQLPTHPDPVSPKLAALADRSQDGKDRTRLLVDGSIPFVDKPQDVVLIRRIVLDPSESDTLRNEAANLLRRSLVADRHDDYLAVIGNLDEGYRFRSFAVQHLAQDWRDGTVADDQAAIVEARLRHIAMDEVEDLAVRREAIWPLAREGDDQVIALAKGLIHDAEATWVHDLCCRIAETHGRHDWADAIHAIATRPREEREAPADSNCCGGSAAPGRDPASIVEPNRLAALRALVALNDPRAEALLRAAAEDANPHAQNLARWGLVQLAKNSADTPAEAQP